MNCGLDLLIKAITSDLDDETVGKKNESEKYFSGKNMGKRKRKKLMAATEISKELDLSTQRVYQMMADDVLGKVTRKGTRVYVERDAVKKFKDEHLRANMMYRSRK